MHQDLRDSIQFCYKTAETTYDEILNEILDVEWEKSTEVKTTSLKAKSAVATTEDRGIKDLKQKIDQLTTVVKSLTFGGAKSKKGNTGVTNVASGQYTGKDKNKKPASLQRAGTHYLSSWTLQEWTETLPMLQLWRMGHSYRQCSSQGASIGEG